VSSGAASTATVRRTSPPHQQHLGHVQRRRREARPGRSAAAIGREREAAKRGQAVLGLADRGAGELAPLARDHAEALGARRLELGHAAQRGPSDAAAIRLLEAEPRLVLAARRDHDRGRVDAWIHEPAERGDRRCAAAPGAADGLAEPPGENLALRGREDERLVLSTDGHRFRSLRPRTALRPL
jgi:hypothetical protein